MAAFVQCCCDDHYSFVLSFSFNNIAKEEQVVVRMTKLFACITLGLMSLTIGEADLRSDRFQGIGHSLNCLLLSHSVVEENHI